MLDYSKIPYVGNAAYCYANCTTMLLASKGENISPSFIEVLTGVGLSAEKRKNGFLFFNHPNLPPDLALSLREIAKIEKEIENEMIKFNHIIINRPQKFIRSLEGN